MIDRVCVFMRGINVNGLRFKMKDLKNVFEDIGFEDVKTVLASGNVIIQIDFQDVNLETLQIQIEEKLRERFKYEAYTQLRSTDQLKSILDQARDFQIQENLQTYLLICDDLTLQKELFTLFHSCKHKKQEEVSVIDQDLIWIVPKGHTLNTEFGKTILGKKEYKHRLTSRNINTINRSYKLMIE